MFRSSARPNSSPAKNSAQAAVSNGRLTGDAAVIASHRASKTPVFRRAMAKQSRERREPWDSLDCFVASLLAMTNASKRPSPLVDGAELVVRNHDMFAVRRARDQLFVI